MTQCVGDAADLLLRLEGTFDVPAAWRVRDEVARAPRLARVIVDFTHVTHCHEFALAVLFTALATLRRGGVEMRGLSKHHLTLLRYLGFEEKTNLPGIAELDLAASAA